MKTKNIFYLALLLFVPQIAGAQTVTSILQNLTSRVVWPIAYAAIIIFWIITGILFLAAMGQPEKVKTARNALIFSLAGTVVIILAASALSVVSNALL